MFRNNFQSFFHIIKLFKSSQKTHNPTFLFINKSKLIHTTTIQAAKLFHDTENQYAHQILKSIENNSIFKGLTDLVEVDDFEFDQICREKSWSTKSYDFIVESFQIIANFSKKNEISITDERFVLLTDVITDNLMKFTDEQVLTIFKNLTLFPEVETINSRNFLEIWSALDDVCVDRIKNWNVEKLLYVADLWYALRLAKTCKYTWEMQKRIDRKLKKLPAHQLVQTMFYVNLCRKPVLDMFNLEYNFNSSINQMSLGEISVMAMGFFKTETPLRNQLLITEIYKRTMTDINSLHNIGLVNILKILRYSSKLQQTELLQKFLDSLITQIPRLSLLSCLHIALAGTDIQLCHKKSLEVIIDRFLKEIGTARLKDMERISFVMGLYNLQTTSKKEDLLCQAILKEIPKRIKEITKYPRCLPACLHYLSLKGFHSEKLINSVLDPKYLELAYGRNIIQGREVFCLDAFTRINLKNSYKGHQLKRQTLKTLGKMTTYYIPVAKQKHRISATDAIQLEVKTLCDDLYKNNCRINHILPHFQRPDLILAFNGNEPFDVKENFPEDYSGTILTREILLRDKSENLNLKIVPLVIGGWNNFIRAESKLTGLLEMKMTQMRVLGHFPVLVRFFKIFFV